jgi:ATP-binding cassette, subfamily B, multidrug efflux pump
MAQSRLRKLGEYLRPHWRNAVLGIVALLIVNAVGVYVPLLIKDAVDELRQALDFAVVWNFILLIFILTSIMWFIRMASRILLFGVGRQVEFDLKQNIFQHLLRLEPAYFYANPAGDLINKATSDVDNIRRLLGFAVLSIANTIFAYALTLPVMLTIDVKLTLWSLSIYPLMLVAVQLFSDRLRSEQLAVQEELSDLSELIQEDMSGMALIKIYAQEENERKAFHDLNQQLLQANLLLAKSRNTLFPIVQSLAYVSLLVLLWLGTRAIQAQEITVGGFVALIIYSERLVFPTALLGFTITAYQRGEVSVDRIESIVTVEPQIKNSPQPTNLPAPIQGKLEARHLSYTYPGSKVPALKDVSFSISPGETVAIVGSIGSGKSTLANALPRLLDIAPNELFLDGCDLTQVNLADLRGAIAYVPQDSFLFSTTVKNNISYGDPTLPQSRIETVAKYAQVHQEILNFPQKYETIVGERGINLSGGQRQRTSLARALVLDAPVLILDDALSSVDNQTATDILHSLSGGSSRRTVIFISHQLSAAATSDRILVMHQGEIVQSGTHAELIQQPGLYKSLWNQHQLEELLS